MQFKIGLCQLTVTGDKATNLGRARFMLEEAAQMGAKVVVLPEMWVCPYSHQYFAECAEKLDDTENPSPAYSMLSDVSSSYGITVVGGSLPEWRNGRLYNTCCVFGSDGKLIAICICLTIMSLKLMLHLRSQTLLLPEIGLQLSTQVWICQSDVGCIGLGICHDIRFPELAMLYRAKGAEMIIYPGAFNMSTGKMLWELETKGRAIDNQSGEVKASAKHEEKIVITEIDYSENQLQRKFFALQHQRKQNVYQFSDLPQ